jgi:hypothetical protein
VEGDSGLACVFGNESFIGVRFFAPETVVKVSHDKRQPPVLQKKIEKDHRIDSAAYRHNHLLLLTEQPVCAAEFPETRRKSIRREHGGTVGPW